MIDVADSGGSVLGAKGAEQPAPISRSLTISLCRRFSALQLWQSRPISRHDVRNGRRRVSGQAAPHSGHLDFDDLCILGLHVLGDRALLGQERRP